MADSNPAPAAFSAATLLHRFELCADNGGSYLEFSGVSPSVFEEFYKLLDGRGRITYFGSTSGVLSVKMPTLHHESVTTTVIDVAKRQVPAVIRVGATRCDSIHTLAGAKEPDDGVMPRHMLFAGAVFPPLVLEVANTQSLTAARKAMRWWFNNSARNHPRGEVRNVIIVKIHHIHDDDNKHSKIYFEVWRRGATQPKKAYIQLKSPDQQPEERVNPDI